MTTVKTEIWFSCAAGLYLFKIQYGERNLSVTVEKCLLGHHHPADTVIQKKLPSSAWSVSQQLLVNH